MIERHRRGTELDGHAIGETSEQNDVFKPPFCSDVSGPRRVVPGNGAGGGCVTRRVRKVAAMATTLHDFQQIIDATYGVRDRERGIPATIAWLTEELGELAQAVRKGTVDQQIHELGDVLAWTVSLANQLGIDAEVAVARYADGCPRCSQIPCEC